MKIILKHEVFKLSPSSSISFVHKYRVEDFDMFKWEWVRLQTPKVSVGRQNFLPIPAESLSISHGP